MPNDYLSSLPEEMLEEISKFFKHGYTNSSYSALAQSCKSLRPHFQRRLFSNVNLAAEIRLRKFTELIRVNPILASYIRTISLTTDNMCMGLFQYSPLFAIMHAVSSSSGTLAEIHLKIGALLNYSNEIRNNLRLSKRTHILNAPQNILDAITHLQVTDNMEEAIPAGLFSLLSNLRVVSGYFVVSSISDKPSNNCSAEDHTPEPFRPKLHELKLGGSNPATITMICEQILDLSAVKNFELFYAHVESTSEAYLKNAKYFLAQRLLDHAQTVQKIHFDIGVMVGPFYNLSRLQRLHECALDINVEAEHDLKYLHLNLDFIDIPRDAKYITIFQVLFSLDTWSEFDAALVDVGASGMRQFKLTLYFGTDTPKLSFVRVPNNIFVDWEKKYLPRSSQQQNLKINILHPYSFHIL
ncbi:hypothetical protein BDN70DRAFT_938244 [Pholiota conissans]|uniref:Uncharacterized protein n=1 Tax=Pholiota conissans TaxID=109636 RepID=A0A9P5YNZ3_9AGAR|nr:hypothetical protein BDN70DRAFT_938244 [Pholiota conissans]